MSRRILDLSTLPWQLGRGAAPAFQRRAGRRPRAVARVAARNGARRRPRGSDRGRPHPAGGDARGHRGRRLGRRLRLVVSRRAARVGYAARSTIVVLEADGIDYYSAIWLDDSAAGDPRRHVRAGRRSSCRLRSRAGPARAGDPDLGRRRAAGLPNPPRVAPLRWLFSKLSPGFEYFPDRMATPKAQFSFGWDFSPRLLSTGIWDGLRLVVARGAYIEDLWVRAEPLSESRIRRPRAGGCAWRACRAARASAGQVSWQARRARRAEVTVAGRWRGDRAVRENIRLRGPSADLDLDLELVDVPSVRRWWPWDQGEPCLYRVTVRLPDEAGPDGRDQPGDRRAHGGAGRSAGRQPVALR